MRDARRWLDGEGGGGGEGGERGERGDGTRYILKRRVTRESRPRAADAEADEDGSG